MLKLLDGPNFSGRSTALRNAVQATREQEQHSVAYIGPEVFTSFSGLAATVEGELELADDGPASRYVSALNIEHLVHRNMSALSGGEEVLCAIAAGLACRPAHIALDCVLEQLDLHRRNRTLTALQQCEAREVLLADNRSAEWLDSAVVARQPVPLPSVLSGQFAGINGSASIAQCAEHATEIVISGLCHRYGNGPLVLDNLDLRLAQGRIVHLAGENGAGKSTFAKILVGVIAPTGGQIIHNGTATPWRRPGRLASYHFQNPDMQLFCQTVKEELKVGAQVKGRSAAMIADLVQMSANAFGLSGICNTHPHELPFSMRKRVALAATFACGTPWIILDEPTLGQDDQAVDQLAIYLRRMATAGAGVIVISHSTSFVSKLPHETVTLANGKAEQ